LKEPKNISNNFLVLENIQDAGNVGTIIHSASGTSFKDIFLINCASVFNQKVVRSTMGGIFKENLCPLVIADMSGQNLFKFKKPTSNFGVVIGNEGKRVSVRK